jgi:hypothetical protein
MVSLRHKLPNKKHKSKFTNAKFIPIYAVKKDLLPISPCSNGSGNGVPYRDSGIPEIMYGREFEGWQCRGRRVSCVLKSPGILTQSTASRYSVRQCCWYYSFSGDKDVS